MTLTHCFQCSSARQRGKSPAYNAGQNDTKMEDILKALTEMVEAVVVYINDVCVESGSKCGPMIVSELRQMEKNTRTTFRVLLLCHCGSVEGETVRSFLVQCQSLIKLNGTHSDLKLHVTDDGSVVRDGVLYKSSTIEIAGFELRDEEFVVVSKKVRKLVELLYISHPQVEYSFTMQTAIRQSNIWRYPLVEGDQCLNSVARMGQRFNVASDAMYYTLSPEANSGWLLHPLLGQTFKISQTGGDFPSPLSISAGVGLIPPIKYSKLKANNKKLSANSFLSVVKILVFGPGGLPLWMDNTDPAHLASCVADWGNYGVSLHPREASGMEEDSTGRNYNVVSERDGEIPTSDKKRMLILIVLICSPSTEILMMERLKYISDARRKLQSGSGDVLTQCSKQCRLASQSVLNKIFFNYTKDQQLSKTISTALPCLSGAIASIISNSENKMFRSKCLAILRPMRDDQNRSESNIHTTDDAEVNTEDEIGSAAMEENLKETILYSLNRLTKYPGVLQRDLLLVGRCTKRNVPCVQTTSPPLWYKEVDETTSANHQNDLNGHRENDPSKIMSSGKSDSLQTTTKSYLCKYLSRKRRQNLSDDETTHDGYSSKPQSVSQRKYLPSDDLPYMNNIDVWSPGLSAPLLGDRCGNVISTAPQTVPPTFECLGTEELAVYEEIGENRALIDLECDDITQGSDSDMSLSPGNLTFSTDFGSNDESEQDSGSFVFQPGVHPQRCSKQVSTPTPSVVQSEVHPSVCCDQDSPSSPSILQNRQFCIPRCESTQLNITTTLHRGSNAALDVSDSTFLEGESSCQNVPAEHMEDTLSDFDSLTELTSFKCDDKPSTFKKLQNMKNERENTSSESETQFDSDDFQW